MRVKTLTFPQSGDAFSDLGAIHDQIRALAYWLSETKTDTSVDPAIVRSTGELLERLAAEARATTTLLRGNGL